MFVIKYDKGSMVKLVQAIQKQPAIYDTNSHYSKEEQDRGWNTVAEEVGEKDSLCRDRWHSIRSCYVRHLKYAALNSKRKPYYLAEYLDFLMPFCVDRVKHFLTMKKSELANLPLYLKEALPKPRLAMDSFLMQPLASEHNIQLVKSEPVDVKSEPIDVEEEGEHVDVEGVDDDAWTKQMQQPSSSKPKPKPKRFKPEATSSSSKKAKPDTSRNKNDDVIFLKSLLPDVARMSGHQKLKFKQETLSIIEDILYATDDMGASE